MEHYLPLGPLEGKPILDEFTYEEVKEGQCVASVSTNICQYLQNLTESDGSKYMCVCVPCYNEDLSELLKTLVSLLENFEFMEKKARMYDDNAGDALRMEFRRTKPVIVPILDGTKALSPTMKKWLGTNFPGLLDDLEGPSKAGQVDVRISCSKWWYYCADHLQDHQDDTQSFSRSRRASDVAFDPSRTSDVDDEILSRMARSRNILNTDGSFRARTSLSQLGLSTNMSAGADFNADNVLFFHLVPIVKRSNHRKHNSHQWFFDSICQGLDDKTSFAFLTDCGTTYNPTCLARLSYELYFKNDLIGVTARQRVETPNLYFHPCEDSPFSCFKGDHSTGDQRPCWKCYATFFFSPCPLQGFEFEATLIMNSAMFNLVEALPVMPGPCQLLNWQKMKSFRVVEEYFNLLFKAESERKLPRLPKSFKKMKNVPGNTSDAIVATNAKTKKNKIAAKNTGNISFTEFLRVNMRLAEDRILSFVCVFSTGYGTKWIPGATFFYQPEIHWQSLLTQRRRWLNGTFASFLFFFLSRRARSRISGGLFDSHKAGKNIRLVNALWTLQLLQLILVLISPAVFGSATYIGVLDSAKRWPAAFDWAKYEIGNGVIVADFWLGSYLAMYSVWTLSSYYVGKRSEDLCRFLAVAGFVYVFPVYFAVWYSIFTDGLNVISGLVIASLLLPVIIAVAQSSTSAALYLLYLPWFMFLIIFFLVFIPSYSFARLWDTTWGNRATGKDSEINDLTEKTMKFRNLVFIYFLVFLNIGLSVLFLEMFRYGGYTVILAFMFIVFCPMIVQLLCSILFLFIVVPLRNLTNRSIVGPKEDANTLGSVYGSSNSSLPSMDAYPSPSRATSANIGLALQETNSNNSSASNSANNSVNHSNDNHIVSILKTKRTSKKEKGVRISDNESESEHSDSGNDANNTRNPMQADSIINV